MKKKASDATIEELISDLTHYEDPDTALSIATTSDGGVSLMRVDGNFFVKGDTLHEALVAFGRIKFELNDWLLIENDNIVLDWS
jgi:hypothetical protein